jgi:enoyl-CoA hydratase/carnithine racemase
MAAHSQQLVSYARQGHVATITLNRPDKRNAFNADLVRSLRQALADFDGDREARVALLCGAGKAFSSGADVQERQLRTPEEFARLGGRRSPTPTRVICSFARSTGNR